MFETIEKEKINSFKNNLSKCVNVTRKAFTNKQLIISNFSRKNLIGFITYGKASIISINSNSQGDEGGKHLYEPEARQLYRKWDNVKLISEELKDRAVPRKVYGVGMWGLSIKTKERLKEKHGRGLSFGVVVTLKEMNGENRIDDFIKLCMMRGWVVNRIDIENQIDIYNKAEEEIEF